jgi:hypothetical protein
MADVEPARTCLKKRYELRRCDLLSSSPCERQCGPSQSASALGGDRIEFGRDLGEARHHSNGRASGSDHPGHRGQGWYRDKIRPAASTSSLDAFKGRIDDRTRTLR